MKIAKWIGKVVAGIIKLYALYRVAEHAVVGLIIKMEWFVTYYRFHQRASLLSFFESWYGRVREAYDYVIRGFKDPRMRP